MSDDRPILAAVLEYERLNPPLGGLARAQYIRLLRTAIVEGCIDASPVASAELVTFDDFDAYPEPYDDTNQ